jgi:uncharacterized protein
MRHTGVSVTTLCPGPTTSEFAQVANMQGVALMEGPMPIMTAAEVARQGYAALKAGRPEIITGLVNRMIAMSTRFTPTSIFCLAERAKARKVLPPGEIAFAGDGHRQ